MLGKWPLWRRLSEFATAELWRKSSREKCAAGAFIKVRRFARRLRLARPTAGREAAVCEGPFYAAELVRASPILDTVWSFGCMLYRNVKPRVAVRGRNDSEGVLAMIGLGNAWLDAKIDGVGWRATRHPLSRTCCVMTKPRST